MIDLSKKFEKIKNNEFQQYLRTVGSEATIENCGRVWNLWRFFARTNSILDFQKPIGPQVFCHATD